MIYKYIRIADIIKSTLVQVQMSNLSRVVSQLSCKWRTQTAASTQEIRTWVAITLWDPCQGWFPLSRNFSVRTQAKFTCVNEIGAMYERLRVNVKVERGSTLTFARDLPFIASISFTCVRTQNLRNSENPISTPVQPVSTGVENGKNPLQGRIKMSRRLKECEFTFPSLQASSTAFTTSKTPLATCKTWVVGENGKKAN